MSFLQSMVIVALILICGLLILVVLLQKGRGGGLAGAFGGAGGGGSAFGAKTGDVFTWITVVLAVLFMLISVVGNFAMDLSASTVQPPLDAGQAPPGTIPVSPAIPVEGGAVGDDAGAADDLGFLDQATTDDEPGAGTDVEEPTEEEAPAGNDDDGTSTP